MACPKEHLRFRIPQITDYSSNKLDMIDIWENRDGCLSRTGPTMSAERLCARNDGDDQNLLEINTNINKATVAEHRQLYLIL